jgi:hypothetical protein
MEARQIYCSACGREVRVMVSVPPAQDGQAPLHDTELVCLELGEQCGGACPLGAAAPDAMVGRIMRNGLPTTGLHAIRSVCPACGFDTEIVLYGHGRAACTACGNPLMREPPRRAGPA